MAEVMSVCRAAASAGQAVLNDGGSALDAVELAVRTLEDCPYTDAGRGSYPTAAGDIEMDAMIMDGRTLYFGAVGAVGRIHNPISLARQVMIETEHAFLVGPGAEAFADRIGFPRCETADLLVVGEEEHDQAQPDPAGYGGRGPAVEPGSMGTVGAVAIDSNGNVAAGTSTGGVMHQLPGRIGDSPLVGCGAYADNYSAACSATGVGETLMRVVISKQVCDFVASGLSAAAACDAAIRLLEERVSGVGGVIAIDARGGVGFARNTVGMPYALAIGDGEVQSGY
jgi:beta-aspartyl-peptidase (threonine type)